MKLNLCKQFILLFIVLRNCNFVLAQRNNVCKTYLGYLFMDISSDCYYNPTLYKPVPEIVDLYLNGISETHKVTTEDGYVLTLFRIPRKQPNKGVVVLHHPLTANANVWVNQEEESLAFELYKRGYDVWMPNNRGTSYSKGHVNRTISSKEYWNFSFHEIGLYDFKAYIDYIRSKTQNATVVVVSHSMGGTSGLIYASSRPEEAKKSVKLFVHMAPASFMQHVPTLRITALFAPLAQKINNFLHIYSLLDYNAWSIRIGRFAAIHFPFKFVFALMISMATGWSPFQYDPRYFNPMFSEFPSEISWKCLYHYGQIINNNGNFQQYDYGKDKNLQLYGQSNPPPYPVEKIDTPCFNIYSKTDIITTPEDGAILNGRLSNPAKIYGGLEIDGINHLDFHFGKDRKSKIYLKIFELLKKV